MNRFWLLTVLLVLVVGGCRTKSGSRTGWSSSSGDNSMSASYSGYNGSDYITFSTKSAGSIQVVYEAKVSKGNLALRLEDPTGATLWNVTLSQDTASAQLSVQAPQPGKHRMVIEGRDTAGSFKASWVPTK